MDRTQLYVLIAGIALVGAIFTVFYPVLGADGVYQGNAIIDVTLHFVDGNSETYSSRDNIASAFGFIPLQVRDPETGSEISSITYTIQIKADWEGTPTSFSFSGTTHGTAIQYVHAFPVSNEVTAPTTLPKNQWLEIASGSLSTSEINTICANKYTSERNIDIVIHAYVALTITGENGEQDSKIASGEVTVTLAWIPDTIYTEASLTALNINISPTKTLK